MVTFTQIWLFPTQISELCMPRCKIVIQSVKYLRILPVYYFLARCRHCRDTLMRVIGALHQREGYFVRAARGEGALFLKKEFKKGGPAC